MVKPQITLQRVHSNIAATTIPHSDEPPLFNIHSGLYFVGCTDKHPYQFVIQTYLDQLKHALYPV